MAYTEASTKHVHHDEDVSLREDDVLLKTDDPTDSDLDNSLEIADEATAKGAPLSFENSHTSFEDQLRLARERERRRQEKEKESLKGNKAGVPPRTGSIKDRVKAFNNSGNNMDATKFIPRSPTKVWKPVSKSQPVSPVKKDKNLNDSMDLSHAIKYDRDEHADDNTASTTSLPYTGDSSFTSFDEQLRLAREREAKRKAAENSKNPDEGISSLADRVGKFSMSTSQLDHRPSGSSDKCEPSVPLSITTKSASEEDESESLHMSAAHLEEQVSHQVPLAYHHSFTSFEDQLRIARERERRRQQKEGGGDNKSSRTVNTGGVSIKDRMKAFQ